MASEPPADVVAALGGVQSAGSALDATFVTALFDALTHPSRRHVLRYASACDRPATATELADSLARRDGDDATRAHERVALLHTHLPKLRDLGLVEVVGPDGTEVDDGVADAEGGDCVVSLTTRGEAVADELYA